MSEIYMTLGAVGFWALIGIACFRNRRERKHVARVDELRSESSFFGTRFALEGCPTCRRRAIRAHNAMIDEMVAYWGEKDRGRYEKMKLKEEVL